MKYIDRSTVLLQTALDFAPRTENASRYLFALGHLALGSKLIFESIRAKNITSLVTRAGWVVWGLSNLLEAKQRLHNGPANPPVENKTPWKYRLSWALMFGIQASRSLYDIYNETWIWKLNASLSFTNLYGPSTSIQAQASEYAKHPTFSAPCKAIASTAYNNYFDPFSPLFSYASPAKTNLLAKVMPSRYTSTAWPGNILEDIKQALTPNIFV